MTCDVGFWFYAKNHKRFVDQKNLFVWIDPDCCGLDLKDFDALVVEKLGL